MRHLAYIVIAALLAARAALASEPILETWNAAACDFTNTAQFSVDAPIHLDAFELWYHWSAGESAVDYTVAFKGHQIGHGTLVRSECDKHQEAWCLARAEPGAELVPGTYTIKTKRARICQNTASGNHGFIRAFASSAKAQAAPEISKIPGPGPVEGGGTASEAPALSEEATPQATALESTPDAWRSPVDEVLFAGEKTDLFLPHQAGGGVFDQHARYEEGEFIVDVPEGNGWGKVGLLTNDPVVWLDDFHDDAEIRVTFTLDPERTTGFGLALAQPGWGGVSGNDPAYPSARYYWIRQRDGASAKAEFHVDPHRDGDFWHEDVSPKPPATVAFVLRPGLVAVEVDGVKVAERPWETLADGTGFRVYAFSQSSEANLPVKMGLKEIRVHRTYPVQAAASGPAPGVAPLPTDVLFDGKPNDLFEPIGVAGGDFQKFAQFSGGALVINVPEGNNWGKTGLLSTKPLVVLDERTRITPTRLTLTVDPKRTTEFVVALSTNKVADMWSDELSWFTVARLPNEEGYLIAVKYDSYAEWSRKVPAAWMDAYWHGQLEYDFSDHRACLRIPNGPLVCGRVAITPGYSLYATVFAQAPEPNAATQLAIKNISVGLRTPPGLTREDRWALVGTDQFDPEAFLKELAGELR